MTVSPPGNTCAHFSRLCHHVFVPGHYTLLRLPVEHCALHETEVEPLEAGMPSLFFGPDGKVITRQTCTPARFQHSCAPILAEQKTTLSAETETPRQREQIRRTSQRLQDESAHLQTASQQAWARAQALFQQSQRHYAAYVNGSHRPPARFVLQAA